MLLNGLVARCGGERVWRGGLWVETRRWMAEYRSISAGFEIAEFISAKQADTTAWSKVPPVQRDLDSKRPRINK